MLLNKANLDFLFQTFLTRFEAAYATAGPMYWPLFCEEVPSTTDRNVYGWLAEMTGMREWSAERQIDDVVARDYELINKDYEKTVGLERNKVADDQYGVFSKTADMIGKQAAWWPDDVVIDTLVNGISQLAYDGQNYYDAAHPVDLDDPSRGTYRNRYDSTVTGGGVAFPLTLDNYAALRAVAMSYLGESGRPLNIIMDTVMVPPQLEKAGLQILNAQLIAQQIGANAGAAPTNVYQGTARLIVNGRLKDPNTWYMFCTTHGIMPLLWQLRSAPNFVFKNSPTDDNMFFDKRLIYGCDGRGNAGYSFPFLSIRAST